MTRKSLLALLLVAVMLLSGCSLVVKDGKVDALQTIIDVNGDIVNKQSFASAYEYNLYMEQYYAQLSAMYLGSQQDVDEAQVQEQVIASYVTSIVKTQKCKELGFDQFTPEEEAALKEKAAADFAEQLASVKEYYFADSTLEGEALEAEVKAYAENMGYTEEAMLSNARSEKMTEKLQSYVKDPVTVDESELQAALDAKITAEQDSYAADLGAYGKTVNAGNTALVTPEGYRTVRVIEVAKTATDNTAATVTGEALTAQPDEARETVDALYARLTAGEAFAALTEDQKSYALCAASTDVDAAIVTAALALTDKGAYTAVIETAKGYALACYEDDIAADVKTLDDVRASITAETLEAKQTQAYDDAVAAWEKAADVKIYRERLN